MADVEFNAPLDHDTMSRIRPNAFLAWRKKEARGYGCDVFFPVALQKQAGRSIPRATCEDYNASFIPITAIEDF